MEGGKEDETNFLPLPEIRMPGMVQGQTQYGCTAEQTGSKRSVKGKIESETNQKKGQRVQSV